MIRLAAWVAYQADRFTCNRDPDGRPQCQDGRLGYCRRPPVPYWWKFEGQNLPICPALIVRPWVWRLFPLYRAWTAGQALEAGGLAQQPAWYVAAMTEIAGAVARMDREKLDAEKRQHERPK